MLLQNFALHNVGPESGHWLFPISWRKPIWPWVYMHGLEGIRYWLEAERETEVLKGEKISPKYTVSQWDPESLICNVSVFHSLIPPPLNWSGSSGVAAFKGEALTWKKSTPIKNCRKCHQKTQSKSSNFMPKADNVLPHPAWAQISSNNHYHVS